MATSGWPEGTRGREAASPAPEGRGSDSTGPSAAKGTTTENRLLAIHDRLLERYGEPPPRALQDPLSELIQTVLSQNTADVNSDRAYASLMERFGGDWEAVRAAAVSEIADAIRRGGLAEIKAVRIKSILDSIVEKVGELDLAFLHEVPLEEGRAFLRGLGGVGPKTAACVLLFACGKPALPVDTHVHRVSQRLGLVPPKATAEQAHALLEAMVPDGLVYSFHMLLIGHGRQVCKAPRPRCFECPVVDLCPYPDKELGVRGRGSANDQNRARGVTRVAHAGPLQSGEVARDRKSAATGIEQANDSPRKAGSAQRSNPRPPQSPEATA